MWIISANNIYADGKSRRHLFSFLKLFQKLADSKGRAFGRSPQTAKPLCLFKAQERVNFLSKGKKEGKPSPGVFLFNKHFVAFRQRAFASLPFPNFCTAAKVPKTRREGTPLAVTPRLRFLQKKGLAKNFIPTKGSSRYLSLPTKGGYYRTNFGRTFCTANKHCR